VRSFACNAGDIYVKNLRHILLTAWLISLSTVAGCSQPVLDYRNAEVSDGLIYAAGANEPFTGSVTHVPDSFIIHGDGHAKFMKEAVGNEYAAARMVQAILGRDSSTSLCTASARKGYIDGTALCYRPQSDTRIIEARFASGQLTGKFVYYNPDKPDQKLTEGSFDDGGQPDGTQKIYSASTGELVTKLNWSHGLYDGDYAKYNESNGKLVLKGSFVDGKANGTSEQYTPDGRQLIARVGHKNGYLDGREEHFDAETGKRTLLVDQWIEGKINGNRKIWDKQGTLISDENFSNGVLVPSKGSDVQSNSLKNQLTEALTSPSPAASSQQQNAAKESPPVTDLDACVGGWTTAYHKEAGADAMVTTDQLDEWQEWCRQGKLAP
jgi:antitoxin component YwqK of YwqJK toxin-antitoxin module